jgi:hypothetical protein
MKHWDLGKKKVEGVSPSAKKPTTHEPSTKPVGENPKPEIDADVVGIIV